MPLMLTSTVVALTFLVGLPLALILHEASHAIAALAVGFRVYRVEIGGRRPLRTGWWGQTEIVVGRPSFRGRLYSARITLPGWRWRKALVALGGPPGSSLVAASCFAAVNVVPEGIPRRSCSFSVE